MKKWKVALIGCGSIADNTYLPRIKDIPEADMVAVCDIIPERAKDYAEKFNVPAWYTSIDELLEKCDFEILMNTTSIPAHHEINMKALNAGKHLYSQKPVGLTVAEVTEQIEAAKAAGVKYTASPIHMLRDDIRFAKKLIEDGCIGEIMKVHTNVCHGGPEYFQYRTADPTWFHRPGSGALYDMGVHGLTMTTGILGPAKAVGCMAKISEPVRTVRTGTFDGMKIQADQLYHYPGLRRQSHGGGGIGLLSKRQQSAPDGNLRHQGNDFFCEQWKHESHGFLRGLSGRAGTGNPRLAEADGVGYSGLRDEFLPMQGGSGSDLCHRRRPSRRAAP